MSLFSPAYTGPAAGLEQFGGGEPMPGSTEDPIPVGRSYLGGGGTYNVHGVTEGDSRDMSDTDSDDIPTIPTGKAGHGRLLVTKNVGAFNF